MPPSERTLPGAYRIHKGRPEAPRPSGQYIGWYRGWNWKERALAYDAHIDSLRQRAREKAHEELIEAHRDRQRKIGQLQQDISIEIAEKARTALKALKVKDIPPASLPAFFRAAAVVAQTGSQAEAQAIAVADLLNELQAPGATVHPEEDA